MGKGDIIMKSLIFILLTLSALNASSTTCTKLYYNLEMDSAEFSSLADSTDNSTMMKKTKNLQKDIKEYNKSCCKSKECKDEMVDSLFQLEEIEIALLKMMRQ